MKNMLDSRLGLTHAGDLNLKLYQQLKKQVTDDVINIGVLTPHLGRIIGFAVIDQVKHTIEQYGEDINQETDQHTGA